MDGIKALLGSEKAIAGGVLIICATVLVALGMMAVSEWKEFTRDIFIVYVSGKTLQGAVAMWTDAKKPPISATTEVKIDPKPENTDAATR